MSQFSFKQNCSFIDNKPTILNTWESKVVQKLSELIIVNYLRFKHVHQHSFCGSWYCTNFN